MYQNIGSDPWVEHQARIYRNGQRVKQAIARVKREKEINLAVDRKDLFHRSKTDPVITRNPTKHKGHKDKLWIHNQADSGAIHQRSTRCRVSLWATPKSKTAPVTSTNFETAARQPNIEKLQEKQKRSPKKPCSKQKSSSKRQLQEKKKVRICEARDHHRSHDTLVNRDCFSRKATDRWKMGFDLANSYQTKMRQQCSAPCSSRPKRQILYGQSGYQKLESPIVKSGPSKVKISGDPKYYGKYECLILDNLQADNMKGVALPGGSTAAPTASNGEDPDGEFIFEKFKDRARDDHDENILYKPISDNSEEGSGSEDLGNGSDQGADLQAFGHEMEDQPAYTNLGLENEEDDGPDA